MNGKIVDIVPEPDGPLCEGQHAIWTEEGDLYAWDEETGECSSTKGCRIRGWFVASRPLTELEQGVTFNLQRFLPGWGGDVLAEAREPIPNTSLWLTHFCVRGCLTRLN